MKTETGKTHYRKVYKSDHLGSADLEDMIEAKSNLIFTIAHVKQEWGVRVAGKKGDFNIAYFNENIKPWVINATNGKILKKFANGSSFVEDWAGLTIQLYIDPNVKLKGEVVGGVKIRPQQPKLTKDELVKDGPRWNDAVKAYKDSGSFGAIEQSMVMSDQTKKELQEAANAVS